MYPKDVVYLIHGGPYDLVYNHKAAPPPHANDVRHVWNARIIYIYIIYPWKHPFEKLHVRII